MGNIQLISLERLLVSVFEGITGLGPGRVLWETHSGPRPSASFGDSLYCTLWWQSIEPLPESGGDYAIFPDVASCERDDPLMQHLRHESWCTLQVSFWGMGGFERALAAVHALQSDARWFDLWKVLGFGGVDKVQDISTPFRGIVQVRCSFNLSFYACFGASYPVEWFDSSTWMVSVAPEGSALETEEFEYSKEIHDEQDPCCLS